MICPELVLTTSQFYLACLMCMACLLLGDPDFTHYFHPGPLCDRLYYFPQIFLPHLEVVGFSLLMSPW